MKKKQKNWSKTFLFNITRKFASILWWEWETCKVLFASNIKWKCMVLTRQEWRSSHVPIKKVFRKNKKRKNEKTQ